MITYEQAKEKAYKVLKIYDNTDMKDILLIETLILNNLIKSGKYIEDKKNIIKILRATIDRIEQVMEVKN